MSDLKDSNQHKTRTVYLRWMFLRASLHRGWWLVASLYLVTIANLSPLELVFLGTAQGIAVVLFEIPTGLVADNFSRKWSIVFAHLLMGSGMLLTGLVTSFPALIFTQILWGVAWTFSTGADVAWLTDELDANPFANTVLTQGAKLDQSGAALGIVLFGCMAWLVNLATAVVTAGALMLVLGIYVAVAFRETRFKPSTDANLRKLRETFSHGLSFVSGDRTIAVVLGVTFLVNGADELFTRLFAKGLLELGLPPAPDPVLWLAILALMTLSVGAVILRALEQRLSGKRILVRYYVAASILGGCGILMFAVAPNYLVAMAGVVVVHGIAWNVVRIVSVIWINSRTTSAVRATLQSFLSQAENLGEIVLGFGLGLTAQFTGISFSMLIAAALVFIAAALILRHQQRS